MQPLQQQRCQSAQKENIHFMQRLNQTQQVDDILSLQKSTKNKIFDQTNIIPTSFKQFPTKQEKSVPLQLNFIEFVQDESFNLSRCQITQGDVRQSQVSEFGPLNQTIEIERTVIPRKVLSTITTQTDDIQQDQSLLAYIEVLEKEKIEKDNLIKDLQLQLTNINLKSITDQQQIQEEMEFSFVNGTTQQQQLQITPQINTALVKEVAQQNYYECVANENHYLMRANFQPLQQTMIPKSNKEYFSQTTYY